MNIRAYAKINLSLDIVGRRDDGYHLLETIMQTVSLFDNIEIKENSLGEIRISNSESYLPVNEKNTAYKAAKLFFEHCHLNNAGVDIKIDKNIPSRAGMGGGSADAAAVLKALNVMFRTNLDEKTMFEIGAKIGADVPFCIAGGTCKCEGIGEQITRIAPMPDCVLLICKPPQGMSTKRAFEIIDSYPTLEDHRSLAMQAALESGKIENVAKHVSNRFDETLKLWQVRKIKGSMKAGGALSAIMTGSGSAVYGIFKDENRAKKCGAYLESSGEVFLCKPLGFSEM